MAIVIPSILGSRTPYHPQATEVLNTAYIDFLFEKWHPRIFTSLGAIWTYVASALDLAWTQLHSFLLVSVDHDSNITVENSMIPTYPTSHPTKNPVKVPQTLRLSCNPRDVTLRVDVGLSGHSQRKNLGHWPKSSTDDIVQLTPSTFRVPNPWGQPYQPQTRGGSDCLVFGAGSIMSSVLNQPFEVLSV